MSPNSLRTEQREIETPIKAANFSIIRTGPVDLSDYNVENMVLTPEDENNPELLAELSALTIVETKPKQEPEETKVKDPVDPVDPVKELKREILELKRRGDIEGAKAKLKELTDLENSSTVKSVNSQFSAISTVNSVSVVSSTAPKPQSADTQIYRDLFAKLQKQSALCQKMSDFYSSAN